RGLTYRLARSDVQRILGVDPVDVEDRRQILNVGDLVRGRRVREEVALGVVAQLFVRQPAHPLDERACDLAAVDAGIDRPTDVHEQVDAAHVHHAGEAVDLNVRYTHTLREV